LSLAIRLGIVTLLLLHIAAPYLPESQVWGVWHYTILPPALQWILVLLVAAMGLPPVAEGLRRTIARLWQWIPGKSHRLRWHILLSAAAIVPFWLLRIRHLRWGDAEFIVKALAYTGPDRPIWTIYNWQSPLTIFTHARLWLLLNPITGVGVDTLYALTSILAGGLFVFFALQAADLLGQTVTRKAVISGLLLTTGSVQLFFGYIENYTIMSAGLMLTLYLGLRHLRCGSSIVWPSLSLAVTNAFHPSTIVLWPAMLYLAARPLRQPESESAAGRGAGARWLALLLPPILVFLALSLFMAAAGHGPMAMIIDDRPGGADGIPFVPLFEVTTEWQRYTMFSVGHLLDWLNEHLLISPVGLLLLGVFAVSEVASALRRQGSVREPSADESVRMGAFLAVASLFYLLLTFVWNPDYGGRKDWDLFAPSAFVYTLWAGWLLIGRLRDDRELGRLSLFLISFAALHSATWVCFNTVP
jgi:hypothetical protein